MTEDKTIKKDISIFKTSLLLTLTLSAILFLSFNPASVRKSFAYGNGNTACSGVYASNPVIYALYLKAKGQTISKNDVVTYIKIVNPAKYKHDRNNVFLWNKLYSEDKARLYKLMAYVNSVKYFKNYVKASLSGYIMNKGGFYLTYRNQNNVIMNGMRTDRNIDFIKIEHGNIYYFSKNLTIVYKNAGKFNFLKIPAKKPD